MQEREGVRVAAKMPCSLNHSFSMPYGSLQVQHCLELSCVVAREAGGIQEAEYALSKNSMLLLVLHRQILLIDKARTSGEGHDKLDLDSFWFGDSC